MRHRHVGAAFEHVADVNFAPIESHRLDDFVSNWRFSNERFALQSRPRPRFADKHQLRVNVQPEDNLGSRPHKMRAFFADDNA